MPDSEPDSTDTSDLAKEVITELDPGTVVGDKLILSRRQAIAIATGTIGLGTILGAGSERASAQASGQVGTSSDPVDIEAFDLNAQNGITEAGDDVVSSPDADYEIQKNGTDGSGVINFKV